MRNRYIFCMLLFLATVTTACFEDNTTLGTMDIPEIGIAEFTDTAIVSYSGNKLEITPQVTTTYPEESLTYGWYYYSDKLDNDFADGAEWNGLRSHCISKEKNLSYEVNLPSGNYTFIFEVRSGIDNYYKLQKFKVLIKTSFSDCYYVFKATADGNSELDLLMKDGTVNADVLTRVTGTPMAGVPVNINYIHNQGYINDNTLDYGRAKAMYLFSEKDTRVFETENFKQILDRNTLFYEPLPEEMRLCAVFNGFNLVMFSNQGVHTTMPEDISPSSGRYGASEIGVGGSRFLQGMGSGASYYLTYVFWSENKHAVYTTTCMGSTPARVKYNLPESVNEENLICIGSGLNRMGSDEVDWFLIEDNATRDRYLILLNGKTSTVTEVRKIDPSKHLAKAGVVAGNGLQAKFIYCADDGKLWAYGWENDNEIEVSLPGIEDGASISYLSNQYLNTTSTPSANFNVLIVATQQEGSYKLYVYDDIVGGIPQAAVEPYEGTGYVRHVRYASPKSLSSFDLCMASRPLMPYSD